MTAVFYDLETTDTHPIGQILNYSFIAVDDRYEIVAECSGSIRISPTQLPRAAAILANKTNVSLHQKQADLNEPEALLKISKFLEAIIAESSGRVSLVGYNSSRFDLPFLRTSLMRNGLPPYFRGKLVYRDLLQLVRKLAVSNSDFPRLSAKDPNKLSLRLETLSTAFNILKGKQTHFSRDDVIITIQLAKYLHVHFGLDVRTTECYEGLSLHESRGRGEVFWQLGPEYDLNNPERVKRSPITLLDANRYSALWIHLDRFQEQEDQSCITWVSASTGELFLSKGEEQTDFLELAQRALERFQAVNLTNFFPPSCCDIEQDIYRLHAGMDFAPLNALSSAIWEGDPHKLAQISSRDALILYRRFELNNWDFEQRNPRMEQMLASYAQYRYGGKLLLSKQDGEFAKFHPTLSELFGEIKDFREHADAADAKLLDELDDYYRSSCIFRVSGEHLLAA